jgi:hypothetical protein
MVITRQSLVKQASDNGYDKEAHKRQLLRSIGWRATGKWLPQSVPAVGLIFSNAC